MGENISNEQLFEFMTKMYGDLNGKIDSINNEMKKGFKGLKDEIKETKDKVIVIDQKHGKKLDALFDGYKQTYEKITDLEGKVDEIDLKVEKLDIKIKTQSY